MKNKILFAVLILCCIVFLGARTLVNLAQDVTGILPIANGGTGTGSTLTGIVRGSGSAMTAAELSGDATTSGSNAVTLANTAVTAGSYTNASVTVDAKGRLTAASNGSTGGPPPIESHSASTSAELDFTTCISSTYQNYEIVITRLLPATNQADLLVQVSTDGGVTYDTGALNYSWAGFREPVTGGLTGSSGSSGGFFLTSQGDNGESNVTHTGLSGTYRLFDPLGTDYKQFIGAAVYYRGFDGAGGVNMHGQVWNTTTAVNAFRVKASTGNLTSGTVRCYGLAN